MPRREKTVTRFGIRRQLLTRLVPFLFSLWSASALLSYGMASKYSADFFDKALLNSVDSIIARLRIKDGKISVDLPLSAGGFLTVGDQDKLYFRVSDSQGRGIFGDTDLPNPPADLQLGKPLMSTVPFRDTQVRVAMVKVYVNEAPGYAVTVEVAETMNAREDFQQRMLLSVAVPALFMITVALAATWYGVMRILGRLKSLQDEVATRSEADLRPLSDEKAPEEVYPLVVALNRLLARVADDMNARQRFIANAAHQLRTPLAGLKTYSSIGTEMCETEELLHIVRQLDEGIDRSSRMVAQLLALARSDRVAGDARSMDKVDLVELAEHVVTDLQREAETRNVTVRTEWDEVPATIHGDGTAVRHLLANVIENAIFYSPSNGSVVVSIKGGPAVTLTVSDSGPGIPKEEAEKVFERFYRIPGTPGNGSGLGLSIVKEVAIAHNATVNITNGSDGIGSRVSVVFTGG